MIKKLLTLSFVFITFYASAQINQGTILVGASSSSGIQSVKTGNSSETLFNLNTRIGYFFSDNLAFGANIGITKFGGFDQTTFGAFGRYYISGKYFLGAGYSSSKSNGNNSVGLLSFEGGYAAFLTDNISIEPALTYQVGTGDASQNSTFGLAVGFSLYFNRD